MKMSFNGSGAHEAPGQEPVNAHEAENNAARTAGGMTIENTAGAGRDESDFEIHLQKPCWQLQQQQQQQKEQQ